MSSTSRTDPAAPGWSLAARLTIWYAGSAFLLVLGATVVLYWALFSNLDREDDQFLEDKVRALTTLLRAGPAESSALQREVTGNPSARESALIFVRILDPGGQIVQETPGMADGLPIELFPDAIPGGSAAIRGMELHTPGGKTFRVTA